MYAVPAVRLGSSELCVFPSLGGASWLSMGSDLNSACPPSDSAASRRPLSAPAWSPRLPPTPPAWSPCLRASATTPLPLLCLDAFVRQFTELSLEMYAFDGLNYTLKCHLHWGKKIPSCPSLSLHHTHFCCQFLRDRNHYFFISQHLLMETGLCCWNRITCVFFSFFFFCGMQDLGYPTSDGTWAPAVEVQSPDTLHRQEIP